VSIRNASELVRMERERCAMLAELWLNNAYIKLHAGEMTAQELRSVRAVVQAIVRQIREQD
jgi:hypothetical protein